MNCIEKLSDKSRIFGWEKLEALLPAYCALSKEESLYKRANKMADAIVAALSSDTAELGDIYVYHDDSNHSWGNFAFIGGKAYYRLGRGDRSSKTALWCLHTEEQVAHPNL